MESCASASRFSELDEGEDNLAGDLTASLTFIPFQGSILLHVNLDAAAVQSTCYATGFCKISPRDTAYLP